MAAEELKVHLLTRGAHYHGSLHYSDVPAAVRPRLLDFLNTQARGRAGTGLKAAVPMLHLDDADIVVYRADSKISLRSPRAAVAVRAVVVAFDELPVRRDSAGPIDYEKRQALEERPLVILSRTRHRLVGKVRGGMKRLTVRTADEPFVALTNVTIGDLSTEARALANLPFVALNMDFVEAFWEA